MAEEEGETISPDQEIDFCTLGMFIIDEIHYLPPKPPVFDILGGAGSYAALGARLFSPNLSKTVSWIVDRGSDFPPAINDLINSWSTSCLIRTDTSRLTTRGWNGYDSNQNRAFKYTTPKLRLDVDSITSQPALLLSKSFHLICNPHRCIQLVTTLLKQRKLLSPSHPKPLIIWEPVPDLCTASELLNTTNVLPYVDICSPNHAELASLMGDPAAGLDPETGEISTAAVERACEQLLSAMPLQSYALVIRCGEKGVYLAKNGGRSRRPSFNKKKRPKNYARGGLTLDMDMESLFSDLLRPNSEGMFEREEIPIDAGTEIWLPAVHQDEEKVIDPTGGGNGFLGGLAVGLARGRSLKESAAMGSVAASFMIEQVGVPVLGLDDSGKEVWNGISVEARMEEFWERVKK